MTRREPIFIFLLAGALALVPWLILFALNHGPLSIPPELADDSIYYYTRIETVIGDHPFIGNPYFKEDAGAMASAFFGADWIASAPRALGVPLIPSILLNLFVWSGVYALLAWWLLGLAGVSGKKRLAGVALLYVAAYWLLERPVAMQVVFPVYLLFMGTFLAWLNEPRSWVRSALLVIAAALTFYTYTYLWQIVAVAIAALHLLFLSRSPKKYLSLLAIDVAIAVIIAPIVIYTYRQLHAPFYWETVTRIGYVATHTFGSAGLVNLALIALALATYFLSARRRHSEPLKLFMLSMTLALLGASFSNVITGKDLETAVHLQRFIVIWAAFAAAISYAGVMRPLTKARVAGLAAGALIALYALYGFASSAKNVLTSATLLPERYAPVLSWLASHTAPGSVVLADDALVGYVPLMARDYVLFHPAGGLYLASDREVEDRYLASRVFANLTLDDIKNDYRAYAGVGNAVHDFKIHNREAALCRIFIRTGCAASVTDAVAYRGEAYFDDLYTRYEAMKRAPLARLKAYGVEYVVRSNDDAWTIPAGMVQVASTTSFAIYRLP